MEYIFILVHYFSALLFSARKTDPLFVSQMEKLIQQFREVEELFLHRPISFLFCRRFYSGKYTSVIKTLNDGTRFSATFNIENPLLTFRLAFCWLFHAKSLVLLKTKFLFKFHTCGTAKTKIFFAALQPEISNSTAVTFYTQEKS